MGEQPIVEMKLIIQFGYFTLLRYKYWIEGHFWEDQKNVHSPSASPKLKGTGIAKYYPPLVIE